MLNVLDHVTMRTLGNIHIESSQRKIGLQVTSFGLYDAVCAWVKRTRVGPIMASAP